MDGLSKSILVFKKMSLDSHTVLFHVSSTKKSVPAVLRRAGIHLAPCYTVSWCLVCFKTSSSWCQEKVGLVFFFPLGKWASLAAVGVSNLGQASYLGWCNENHQYLDVMLETFFMLFCSQRAYVVIRLVIQCVFQKLLQYFVCLFYG